MRKGGRFTTSRKGHKRGDRQLKANLSMTYWMDTETLIKQPLIYFAYSSLKKHFQLRQFMGNLRDHEIGSRER